MGKVLSAFTRGWPGAVSRSKDDVIVSLRNADSAAIAFGAPVFLKPSAGGVVNFESGVTDSAAFVGFAVRVPSKTPDSYAGSEAAFLPDDPVDVLVRGSVVIPVATSVVTVGDSAYIRKSDGRIVAAAGAEGTTVPLPNVTLRGPRDAQGMCEAVVTKRNLT